MKYVSKIPNQMVAFEGGFITFKDGKYETTDKKEQAVLKKVKLVKAVGQQETTTAQTVI